MFRCVDHVVSAIDKSDIDQVLSRKRLSSRLGPSFGVVFARRASPCSSFPTLPGAASAVVASSPGDGCCFRFLVKYLKSAYSYVEVHTNLGQCIQDIEWGSGYSRSPPLLAQGRWFESRMIFFFFVCRFYVFVVVGAMHFVPV